MGGRGLNFWLTALSAHASDMSAWLFMAFPMAIYMGGVPQVWMGLGLLLGMYANWTWIAPRLRSSTEQLNAYTLSTFFERRFGDSWGLLRTLTAVMTLLFMAHYLAAGLIAMGLLLETLFSLEYSFGILLSMAVVVSYTYVGGYVTVAWMDLIQGVFLLLVILAVPIFAYAALPDGQTIELFAQKAGVSLQIIPEWSFTWALQTLGLAFGWGVGYLGLPHVLTKFMGIRNVTDMYKAKRVGLSWQTLVLIASAAVGLIGIPFFQGNLGDPQLVFIDMVRALVHPFIAGFILCAVVAANMSTMDSQILVCASVISEDLYRLFGHQKPTSKRLLHVSRIGVLAMAVIALVLAFNNRDETILATVLYSWAGLGCTFGPLVIMALYAPKTNLAGALAGIICGGLFAAFWPTINPFVCDTCLPATVPGVPITLLIIWLASRFSTHNGKSANPSIS